MHNGPASMLVIVMWITSLRKAFTPNDITPLSETDGSITTRKFAAPVLLEMKVDIALIPEKFFRVCAKPLVSIIDLLSNFLLV